MYQQRQKNVSAMIFHMYQGENGIKTHLVHQRVRISSLRQSLYPVYDAIRCLYETSEKRASDQNRVCFTLVQEFKVDTYKGLRMDTAF